MKKIWKFIKDEDGLELTEYAVIGALIVVGIIAGVTALSTQISAAFSNLATLISGGGGTP